MEWTDFSNINGMDAFPPLLLLRVLYLEKSRGLVTRGDVPSGDLSGHCFIDPPLWKGRVCPRDFDHPTLSRLSLRTLNSNYVSSADRHIQDVQFPSTARQQVWINVVIFCLFLDFSLYFSQKNFLLCFVFLNDTQHFVSFICTAHTRHTAPLCNTRRFLSPF